MNCPNCGVELNDHRRPCPRCGVAYTSVQRLDLLAVEPEPWVPQQRTYHHHEPEPPAAPVNWTRLAGAALTDIVLCGLLLGAMVVVAAEIARARSGTTYADLVHQLRPIHYALFVAVPIAYVVGSWILLDATPGFYVVHWGSPYGRRRAVRAVMPAMVVVALASIFTGITMVGAGTQPYSNAALTDDVARQQALAVDNLLTTSSSSRSGLGPALDSVCQTPAASLQAIQTVQSRRVAEVERAKALRTDALPDGAAIHDYLLEALTRSRDADGAYADYANHVMLQGCTADDNLRRGDSISEQAQVSKKNFLAVWNPVAIRFGFATRSSDTI